MTIRCPTARRVYVVTAGIAQFECEGRRVPVSAGTTLFVPAGVMHRFFEIEEDLVLTVIFAPAYSGKGGSPG